MLKSPYEQTSFFDNMPESISVEKWQKTVNVIAKIFNAPGAWIMQANIEGLEALLASESIQQKFPAGLKFEKEVNIYCKTVLQTKKHLYVKNAKKEGGWDDNPEYTEAGFNSYLGVPLQWPNGEMFGTLCVLDQKETNYPENFIELMWQLKEIIDSDLRNTLLIEELRNASITDELTNILNRRGFMDRSTRLINLAKRNKLSLLLMYFDLNDLKTTNDAYGHQAGDFLINAFAEALKGSVRGEDLIARLGGDEFCFLGIHQLVGNEKSLPLRIKRKFEDLTKNDNRINAATFSLGCKIFTLLDETNIDKMLSETDALMYENKNMMKNSQKI